MTEPVELDDVARRVITDGRHAIDPSELVTARVRRAVDGKLASGTGLPMWPQGSGAPSWVKVLVAGAAACFATAALAYSVWRPNPAALPAAVPSPAAPTQAATKPVTPASVVEPKTEAPSSPVTPEASSLAARAPVGNTRSESLAEEVKFLVGVNSAIRSHDGARALRLLREYDQQFRKPQLREERAAAGVLALCAAGRVEAARGAAERFQSTWPRSPLMARVVESCISSK